MCPQLYTNTIFYSRSNKNYVKGIDYLHEIFSPYNYDVILLGDRDFKSVDLFKFIEKLQWKYCIRCTKNLLVEIERKKKIKYLSDIKPHKKGTKKYSAVLLTAKKYKCNLAICKDEDSDDTWYLTTNMYDKYAVREYKKDSS